jgi:hypothetical protein
MAWRETRGGWRHFVGFFACIALGVAALTAVGTLAANVDRALTREAKALMGGDLELRSARPLDAEGEASVARLRGDGAQALRIRELVGMARDPARGGVVLVELKAVEAGYPLYGRLETEPARPLVELLADGGVLVHETLLARLDVEVGDPIVIGQRPVTIRGVIRKEPDAPAGFALGPRVLLGAETLESTGLVRFGSRVRYRTLLRLPEALAPRETRETLARELSDPTIRVTAFNEAQPGLRRFFTQLTTYLGLVGLLTLLVSVVNTKGCRVLPRSGVAPSGGAQRDITPRLGRWPPQEPPHASHPRAARGADLLQVAVARLVGYRWPRQTGASFPGCAAIESDGLDEHVDDNGIVCLPPVRGERSATDRLRDLLATAYGSDWHPHRVTELLASVGFAERVLEDWLRNGFFEQHCRLFEQHPFIWQIWDGHRDGFSALVNYHRLDRKTLESLTYTYLGEWITVQDRANQTGESGAGDRLVKARVLQKKLELILEGEEPYDIFVRWKPLERQPIGWEPDLADGVRLNIRPFVEAGVLRWKTTIKWGKDRGKSPLGSPWGEERDNDVHLTLAEKRKARGPA